MGGHPAARLGRGTPPSLMIPDKHGEAAVGPGLVRGFAGRLRMWRQRAPAEHRRMRFLNALGVAAARRAGMTVMLLDAVLIAAPVVVATLVAEHLTGQRL